MSENIYVNNARTGEGPSREPSDPRYVCIEKFDRHSDFEDIERCLEDFVKDLRYGGSITKAQILVYSRRFGE